MKKFFNVSGPCRPDKHYMLPAQARCGGLLDLIEHEQYFVIHAARQTGKTTLLLELAQQLNGSGEYYALYCSLEVAQGIVEAERGIPAIVRRLKLQIELSDIPKHNFAEHADYSDFTTILLKELVHFCKKLTKPLVILFDEVDCLSNGTLITFLRQLRDGYVNRGQIPFVHSVALVGMRNIRDYKAKIREDSDTLGSASPFNIVKSSKTLRNFTPDEMAELYAQHTEETGQAFAPRVTERVYHYTRGQPWLVNAVACEIVEQILVSDFSRSITIEHVERAVQTIIRRRDTHIDSLMERLREERVRRIVEPVILGESRGYDVLDDDYSYVLDLGLLCQADAKLMPANPIYGEVIVRTLSSRSQMEMNARGYPPEAPLYVVEGKLDMKRLMGDFQQFWRENSEIWVERYQYKEAAPHLILQAFLQRVVNHGGRIAREMASGTGRLDLCVHYQGEKYPVELKLRYGEKTYAEGRDQLAGYMDKLGCTEGWLIVFDRRKRPSWSEKVFWKTETIAGKTVHVVGC